MKKKRFLLMMLLASMCAVSIAAQNVSPLDMSNALRLSDPVTIVNARVNQGLPRHGNHAPRYHYEREDQYCNSTISLDVAAIRSLPVGEGVWLDVYVHRDDDCEVMTQVQFGFILPEGLQISDIKTHSDTESRFIGPYDPSFPEYNNYVIGETYNGYEWTCNMLNDTTFRAVGWIYYLFFDPSGIAKKDFNLCTIYIEKTKPLGPGAVIKVGNDMPFKYIAGPNGETIWSGAWTAANHIIDLGSIATDPVMSTGITLNKSELSLTTGAAETLVATVSPGNTTNKTVAWASSDTGVATVDTSGKVTAVGVGSCTITATTTDGSNLSATCTVTVRTSDSVTVEIGDGTGKSEVCPIHNWWLRSYQGNEVIYLKEELNLQPGDQITALSYHCVQGSAHGGNFNVRIKNTTLTQTFDGTEDPMDPSVLKVDYNDKVYGNVQLEPYGAGDWITFELSEPFVYEGENIIIDIRNTAPGNYSGWCYFATTKCSPRRSLGWRNAQDEQVSGFVDGYTPYGDYDSGFYIYNETSPYDTEGDYPNIRITYTPGTSSGDVRATGITLNKSELSLTAGATETLVATISPINTTNKTVTWASSNPAVATVDEDGLVTAKAYGTATITATTTDGSNLSATCTVTVRGASDLYGDINGDGVVDIADVNILINLMKGKEDPRATAETADVTGDGVVDIADVNAVINAMLGKASPEVETFTVGGVSFKMVKVEGGTFTMGATAEQGSDAGDRESPAHQVTLSSYSIGQTEVTQELWQAVMGSNPSSFTGNLQRPVEQVSWSDCQTFITKLNQMTGKNFRLPTEAEWEYAARGGNQSRGYKYSGSNTIDDVAWYDGNGGSTAQPVATKAPNELGLYDMSGNVYEWCQDWYGNYSSDAQTDPTGPATGSNRVGRGGCWGSGAKYCRVSYRSHSAPSLTGDRLGLRLALCQIPDGFSQIEYIDVTGGQWIDTGIHADSSIEVQFTTMVAGRMADNTRFFSTHDPHPDYPDYQYPETSKLYDGWNALGTWGLSTEPNDLVIKPLGYNNLVETNCKISDFYNQKITLVLTGTGRFSLVKDNQTLKSYDAGSLTNTSTTSNTDIRLFTRVVYDAHELFKGKVYEVTIAKSNQVVMHLLPYWDNNQDVGAFYDTVSKKFFYSNSSKSF